MSHTLADSQDFAFTSLAAAAAQGWRVPGATQDPICLCKQEKLVFSFVQVAHKGFNIQMRIVPAIHLLDPMMRFYFPVGWI